MYYLKNIFCGLFLVVFCAVLFVVSTKPAVSQNHFPRIKSHLVFKQQFSGIAKVIDGDSIIVDDREVRIFGIDAPEYRQSCFDGKNREYSCGKASRNFLYDLVNGKKVTCHYAQKDKYNRFLGKCEIGALSINQEIIRNGMGVIYNFSESDDVMDALEAKAKEQKLGIWQGAFQLPKEYRKANPRSFPTIQNSSTSPKSSNSWFK